MVLLTKWVHFASAVEDKIESALARIGRATAAHPWRSNFAVLLIGLLCASGFTQITVESKGDKLWIPQNSIPAQNRDYVESVSTFGTPPLGAQIILVAKEGQNCITLEGMDTLFQVFDVVKAQKSAAGDDFESLCLREQGTTGPCVIFDSPLKFWNANFTSYSAEVQGNYTKMVELISRTTTPSGATLNRNNAFGLYTTNAQDQVVFAQAMQVAFALRSGISKLARPLEKVMIAALEVEAERIKALGKYEVHYRLARSIDDELARSVSGDIGLLVGTYILMTIFICCTLGPWDTIKARKCLGGLGVLLIILSISTAYGICMWLGIPFTSLQQVLPFILVGIGADDMFVITATFDRTPKDLSIPERMALTMRHAGLAVTVTSVTNCAAFALGSSTVIPAVRYFCAYASLSIFVIYAFTLLSFSGLLALDEARVLDDRYDCCCCFAKGAYRRQASQLGSVELPVKSSSAETHVSAASNGAPAVEVGNVPLSISDAEFEKSRTDLSKASVFFRDYYAPWLLKPKVKVAVVLFFLGVFVFNLYAITQVVQGFDLVDVTPDDSYVRDFFYAERKNFPNNNFRMEVFFKTVPYTTAETQQQMETYMNQLQANPYSSPPVLCWLTSFQQYYRSTAPYNGFLDNNYLNNSTMFYTGLQQFLLLEDAQTFLQDLHWSDDQSQLLASRCHMFHAPAQNSQIQEKLLVSLRKTTRNTPLNEGRPFSERVAFNYNTFYLFWEQFTIIYGELIQNFILSGLAVVIICTVLLVHPAAAIMLTCIIAIIDVDLLGAIWVWGLEVSSITVIQLVMSVGLVVDYSAHIIHSFMVQQGSREQRVILALTKMGPSILLGSVTTLLGVAPLALASSTIFRTFFSMFLSIIVYGSTHGLILLPVILTWIGPATLHLLPEEKSFRRSVAANPRQSKRNLQDINQSHPDEPEG